MSKATICRPKMCINPFVILVVKKCIQLNLILFWLVVIYLLPIILMEKSSFLLTFALVLSNRRGINPIRKKKHKLGRLIRFELCLKYDAQLKIIVSRVKLLIYLWCIYKQRKYNIRKEVKRFSFGYNLILWIDKQKLSSNCCSSRGSYYSYPMIQTI